MKSPAADPGLIFDWSLRERFPLILFGCVFLSAVAHVATFFLFQVIYPQRVTIPPPPPQVELLTASSPENEALLRWIDAEDPALVANAHAVLPPNLLDVPYRPSYATSRLAPLGSVEAPVLVPFPPARSALAIIQSANPPAEPATRSAVATPSGVTFSGALRARTLTQPAAFTWRRRAAEPAEPFRALIGVNDRGEVRFAIPQQSSGQPALDAQALAQLQTLTFDRAGEPIAWGTATVTFGAEAYENPKSEIPNPQ
jgi:hypothetical protein